MDNSFSSSNNGNASNEYKLSTFQKVHREAVRDMYLYTTGQQQKLATVSRDGEAKVFAFQHGSIQEQPLYTYPISVPLSSVTVFNRPDSPLLLFGCLNGAIFAHIEAETANPLNVFTYHTHNVGILRVDPQSSLLASGSWDNTAVVYNLATDTIRYKILSHTQSVNDVAFVRPTSYQSKLCLLTASSDKTISLWDISDEDGGSGISPMMLSTFMGHDDCVRALYLETPHSEYFFSVSNDQSIKYWNGQTGVDERTLIGHQHFIYTISSLCGNEDRFVTAGEDQTIRIWSKMASDTVQILKLPVVSIWRVLSPDPGTIIAGTSDGRVYVFSCDEAKKASTETLEIYQQLVAKQNIVPLHEVAHLKLYEEYTLHTIPPINGGSGGEKRLIRTLDDDSVVLYEANQDGTWRPIGSVKDYVRQDEVDEKTGRVWFNGEFYDFVITVLLDSKKYRIAYNYQIDPWMVATDFLCQQHLDLDNSNLATVVTALVTGSSYKPIQPKEVFQQTHEYPKHDWMLHTIAPANLEKFQLKLQEVAHSAIQLNPTAYALTTDESRLMFSEQINDFARPTTMAQCATLLAAYRKMFRWQVPEVPENKFVVYDMFRLSIGLSPLFASYCLHHWLSCVDGFFGDGHQQTQQQQKSQQTEVVDQVCAAIATTTTSVALQLTSLRVLTNLFSTVHGAQYMLRQLESIVDTLARLDQLVANVNVHTTYASLWFNYSVVIGEQYRRLGVGGGDGGVGGNIMTENYFDSIVNCLLNRSLQEVDDFYQHHHHQPQQQQSSTTTTTPTPTKEIDSTTICLMLDTFGNLLAYGVANPHRSPLVARWAQAIQQWPKRFGGEMQRNSSIRRQLTQIGKLLIELNWIAVPADNAADAAI